MSRKIQNGVEFAYIIGKTENTLGDDLDLLIQSAKYHEHGEMVKNEFDEEYFMKIAKLDGIPDEKLENTRLMCIYLKDADALDRVRLGNLDVDYLRTSVAKLDMFLSEIENIENKANNKSANGKTINIGSMIETKGLIVKLYEKYFSKSFK